MLIRFLFMCFYFYCTEATHSLNGNANGLSPVILVPGDGGSQLLARWHKKTSGYLCSKTQEAWYQLWLNLEELTPLSVECLADNLRLVYDSNTRTTRNSPGVEIQVKDFGNSSGVEWLSPSHHSYSSYFATIVDKLLSLGYNRSHSIRGAPFDFRKAPNELEDYYVKLQSLIEETHRINGEKVTLIAHSMGAPLLHYFMIYREQLWKDIHIQAIISLSGAWGGALKALKVFAAGYNLDSYFISSLKLRVSQRSDPSLAFLLPSRNLWDPNEILVQTPIKNYSIATFREYFDDIKFPDGYDMYLDTRNLLYNAGAPGVEIHCLYGVGVKTTDRIIYADMSKFPDYPDSIFGDGDGTVNRKSAESCMKWSKMQEKKILPKAFKSVNHMAILKDPGVHQYIVDYLKSTRLANLQRRSVNEGTHRIPIVEDNAISGWKRHLFKLQSREIS